MSTNIQSRKGRRQRAKTLQKTSEAIIAVLRLLCDPKGPSDQIRDLDWDKRPRASVRNTANDLVKITRGCESLDTIGDMAIKRVTRPIADDHAARATCLELTMKFRNKRLKGKRNNPLFGEGLVRVCLGKMRRVYRALVALQDGEEFEAEISTLCAFPSVSGQIVFALELPIVRRAAPRIESNLRAKNLSRENMPTLCRNGKARQSDMLRRMVGMRFSRIIEVKHAHIFCTSRFHPCSTDFTGFFRTQCTDGVGTTKPLVAAPGSHRHNIPTSDNARYVTFAPATPPGDM